MNRASSPRVLIIGAGAAGLALAQGLKQARIPFTIFEKNASQKEKRNWSMNLHWSFDSLEPLVPKEILSKLESTQCDPHIIANDPNQLSFLNGQTGDVLKQVESSRLYRVRRDRFRAMLLTGIDVKWGKSLSDISYAEDGATVTARFADGTQETGSILIATDGPHSAVRTLLLGKEKAKTKPIGYAATMCFTKVSREQALFLRSPPHNPLYQVGVHPNGYCAWLAVQDAEDAEHPEDWTFMHYISYPESGGDTIGRTTREHVAYQKQLAKQFADPWKSIFKWMPDDSETAWNIRLRNWDPSLPDHRWDNALGRVTLAGDAAHPMTFQRGQGLNHAIEDAHQIYKTIRSFWNGGGFTNGDRAKAIEDYETEMIERTGKEVRMSEANTVAAHNWDQINSSHSLKKGLMKD